MKIKFLILAAAFAVTAMAQAATTNDLTGLLQKGLFDEEANRDLNAAIVDYQSVASAFDKDRQLAATAIFRLGEVYRKLGRTNEAAGQYQRIIKEFGDQPTLVTLSRQNLAGMGAPTVVASNSSGSSGAAEELRQQIEQVRAQVAKDSAMLQTLQSMGSDMLRQTLPQVIPDTQLDALEMQLNQAEQDLIKLKLNYTPDHPSYKNAQEVVDKLKKSISERIDGILNGVRARRESEEVYLSQLTAQLNQESKSAEQTNQSVAAATAQLESDEKRLQDLSTRYTAENPLVVEARQRIEADQKAIAQAQLLAARSAKSSGGAPEGAAPVTDEEQQEIRRIQLMIQNSPDLINAPSMGANGDYTPLAMAAARGQLVVARYLLDHGADVNGRSRNLKTVPLLEAAENGHKTMVELLLARGADVSGGRLNPLFEAASRGYVSVAEVLLANKADVNLPSGTDSGGMRPVHVAARDGRTEMLELLIKHGADVNVTNVQGNSPLEFAAEENEIATAKMLLAAKADVNAKDKRGNTALHEAARAGHAEMVSLLLDSGAAVDPLNNPSQATPLLMAVAAGRVDATRVLLEHKADPNHRGWIDDFRPNPSSNPLQRKWQPITFALSLENNNLVKLLLDAGANPEGDSEDPHEQSPLFLAMDRNNVGAVDLLLQHGADPNRDNSGSPPLYYVVAGRRDKRMIPLLLEKGADPNPKETWAAPLLYTGDVEVGRWLLEHKADVNIRRTGNGMTALMMDPNNNTNFLEFLLENGAKTDLQDTNGNTALHWAVYNSRTNSVAILLAHKADPNIQNDNGFTPLDLAKEGMGGHIIGSHMYPNANETRGVIVAVQSKIADMLMADGGLANLPKRDRIEVRRAARSGVVIYKDSQNRNRYSVMELIATQYGLLSQNSSGEWQTHSGSRVPMWASELPFPDLKRVTIYRRTGTQTKPVATIVDVENILSTGDCSKDVWLKWGDVVEIPEADHPVGEFWQGFSDKNANALIKCVSRQATVNIKGENTVLKLGPELKVIHPGTDAERVEKTQASFMLRSVLDNSKLIRVSSDLSRVKVTRMDPETGKKVEWVVDCTDEKHRDLWVRDGDVIEVPEK